MQETVLTQSMDSFEKYVQENVNHVFSLNEHFYPWAKSHILDTFTKALALFGHRFGFSWIFFWYKPLYIFSIRAFSVLFLW